MSLGLFLRQPRLWQFRKEGFEVISDRSRAVSLKLERFEAWSLRIQSNNCSKSIHSFLVPYLLNQLSCKFPRGN
ncbi:unnamed protein product [Auanema sp. JU1783]|nr:unnamed protein product [Auanema sp. JU1783]